MSSGYPKEQLYKLYLRRADCHIELRQRTEARASLDAAILNADSANLSSTSSCMYQSDLFFKPNSLFNIRSYLYYSVISCCFLF